jgi:hypothetical protein
VGAAVSTCVRAVCAGERLKERRGTTKRGSRDSDTAREHATGQGADEAAPLGIERGGERAGRGADRWGPSVSGRGWAAGRLAGPVWAEGPRREGGWASLVFLFVFEFLILFILFFSFEFKFKHTLNSNSNNSNMCIKQ